MNSNQAKLNHDGSQVRCDLVEQRLEELLAFCDANNGYEIVALHIDQALHALKCQKQGARHRLEVTD